MIRALIGRFVLHCVEKAHQCRFDRETKGLDFDTLSHEQISAILHGHAIDVSRPARLPEMAVGDRP